MTWLEINDEIAEINTMQLELQSKLDSDYIKQIIDRNTKYLSIHNFNKYSLKDGVLENKIRITPLELKIISKLNALNLSTDIQDIYSGLSDKEDNTKYIENLYRQYQTALSTLNTLKFIEELAGDEIEEDTPIEETEYAKLIEYENKSLKSCIQVVNTDNVDFYKHLIESTIKDYATKLSNDQILEILFHSIRLSYNRNRYDFLENIKTVDNIMKVVTPSSGIDEIIAVIYSIYHDATTSHLIDLYTERSLDDINSDFKQLAVRVKNKQKRV